MPYRNPNDPYTWDQYFGQTQKPFALPGETPPMGQGFKTARMRKYLQKGREAERGRTSEQARLNELEERLNAVLQASGPLLSEESIRSPSFWETASDTLKDLIPFLALLSGGEDLRGQNRIGRFAGDLASIIDLPVAGFLGAGGGMAARKLPRAAEKVGQAFGRSIPKLPQGLSKRFWDVREPAQKGVEQTIRRISEPGWGFPGSRAARQAYSRLVEEMPDLSQLLQQLRPNAAGELRDYLRQPINRQMMEEFSVFDPGEEFWKLGIQAPEGAYDAFRKWGTSRIASSPLMSDIAERIAHLPDDLLWQLGSRARDIISQLPGEAMAAAKTAGTRMANAFPTVGRDWSEPYAQMAEEYGRKGTDLLSGVVENLQGRGRLAPQQFEKRGQNWYNTMAGPQQRRYQASKPEEGWDPWQREMLQRWYRDIKPTVAPMAESAMEWAQENAPYLRLGAQASMLPLLAYAFTPMPEKDLATGKPLQPWQRMKEAFFPDEQNQIYDRELYGETPPPGYVDTLLSLITGR